MNRSGKLSTGSVSRNVKVEIWDAADDAHIQAVLDLDIIDTNLIIKTCVFTVCLDAVNGVGGKICIGFTATVRLYGTCNQYRADR